MIHFRLAIAFSFFFLGSTILNGQIRTYQETNGLVIVEAESFIDSTSQWRIDTTISGYTGTGYAIYTGPDRFNDPGIGPFAFDVAFAKTGEYRVEWRSRIAIGTSNTEHNDSWLRVNGGQSTYARDGSRILYPKGSGRTPNPEGSGGRGWYKAYQNNLGNWTYNTRTSDRDPHLIYLQVDSAGTYRIEVSGRSNGHAIDRVILFHSDITSSVARNPNLPQTNTTVSSSTEATSLHRTSLYPNPAESQVTVKSEAFQIGKRYTVELIDVKGKVCGSQQILASANQLEVDVQQLSVGVYFLRVAELKRLGEMRFLKQ